MPLKPRHPSPVGPRPVSALVEADDMPAERLRPERVREVLRRLEGGHYESTPARQSIAERVWEALHRDLGRGEASRTGP